MKHLFVPDCQVRPGVPLDHLHALGNYIVKKKPDVIVMIGDFADMPSLNSFDKAGSRQFEGKRYKDDIAWVHLAMDILLAPLAKYNEKRRKDRKKQYHPRMVMTLGNHEQRIQRAIDSNPTHLEGIISMDDLRYKEFGWEVHDFLNVVSIDGVAYSHYFLNPNSASPRPVAGQANTKLNNLKTTFVQGHTQTLQYGVSYDAIGTPIHGIVAGAFYMHDEDYLGPQQNRQHWRGVVMLEDVVDGDYDPSFVRLESLLKHYG
jgi:hypothetical protein